MGWKFPPNGLVKLDDNGDAGSGDGNGGSGPSISVMTKFCWLKQYGPVNMSYISKDKNKSMYKLELNISINETASLMFHGKTKNDPVRISVWVSEWVSECVCEPLSHVLFATRWTVAARLLCA